MNSIQSKLATGLLISLIFVFLILWLTLSNNIQKFSENYIASRLQHDIETLLTAISFDNKNNLTINEQYINSIYKRPFSGHYYAIQHKQNLFRSRSLWDQNLSLPEVSNGEYLSSVQPGPENQLLITITGRFNKHKENIIITIAEDLSPVIKDINQFKNYFTGLSLFILLSLLLIQFIVLRNGLKPLRKIHKELHELEKGIIKELNTDVPVELKSVVNEINQLSLALYKRLKRSRDALSDLSHAIKKPLTLLQQYSDEKQDNLDNKENEFVNNQITSIQQLTDRILKRARISGVSKTNTPFNINEDLPLLINTINSMYPSKNIKVRLDIPETLEIYIDREDMLELLGNLLDNAWKWANTTINITIKKTEHIVIIIEDDGSGANTESLNELTRRGVRLDESVSGYGFGISISSDIIRDYNGSLLFSHSKTLGGFKTEIRLPLNH
ncbi:MAG: sensor histidine kinase [Gammaproteobacteria bacterium]|nr:sensor histidine kinase [Gammaproteobacteria bacterium]MDH5660160.1 sensor histidine kinase [Gammaproteobacteria bacterium]